jgi:predicted secreted Zn-dependent protease
MRAAAVSRAFLSLTCATLLGSCAGASRNPVLDKYPAGISGMTSVLYYDVHGRTFEEVQADMRRKGPKIDGNSFVGETRSPMRWSWRTESIGSGGCAIHSVSVSVNARITLPRWTPPADTEPGLAAEWKRFIAALEMHEAGHKDISAKAARELIDRLRNLSGLCSQLGTQANDIARRIIDRAQTEQQAYDASTRHGLTQGTGFGGPRFRGGSLGIPADSLVLLVGPRAGTVRAFFRAPLDRVWSAVPAAFAAIQLAVNAADSTAHVAGDSITVRTMIGTAAVSEMIDCGPPPTGLNADSVDVALFLTARVASVRRDTTVVMNTLQAVAHPAGAPPMPCRSRGVLERQLLGALGQLILR